MKDCGQPYKNEGPQTGIKIRFFLRGWIWNLGIGWSQQLILDSIDTEAEMMLALFTIDDFLI